MHADVQGCGSADGQADHGAQRTAAHEFGADTAAGGTGGCGRRKHHYRVAAGLQMRQRVLRPGQLRLDPGRHPVGPPLVVRELLVPPVAIAVRRIAEHAPHPQLREGIGTQGVSRAYGDLRIGRRHQQAYGAALSLYGQRVLAVQLGRAPPGRCREQRATAARRIEDTCRATR